MRGNEYGPDLRYRVRGGKFVANGSKGAHIIGNRRARGRMAERRRRNIAVLDLETDHFDNVNCTEVYPFVCVIYSDQFPTITLWEEDWRKLIDLVVQALAALPEPFIIYAHSGGRFDYMFFMHVLEGMVKFKGRALMSAKLGKHEIRDSLQIIPEGLKNANRKEEFNYLKMHKSVRNKHKDEIIAYCISDCAYLFEVVRAFVDKFGLPMTIGQAAMTELRKYYSFGRLTEQSDEYMRQWFFGGRVECMADGGLEIDDEGNTFAVHSGVYRGDYKLYDVNSMYPSVMAHVKHPISNGYTINDRNPKISKHTVFIHLECDNNGAFLSRLESGELTTEKQSGEFFTTIHEYKMACELGLIANERLIKIVDFPVWTTFSNCILPLYSQREKLKLTLAQQPDHIDKKSIEQEIKFLKYLLNNIYGKFAQNPRRFREYMLTKPEEKPDLAWLYFGIDGETQEEIDREKLMRRIPAEETELYTIWARPIAEWRFNNVATAASITGAARAKFLRAKHFAIDPLYGDTDSIVCRELRHHKLDIAKLGAWKLETEISEFILAGKKLYGYRTPSGKEIIRAKGAQGVTWAQLQAIIRGETVRSRMFAPTITRDQTQRYMVRELRATA